jgi:hypothetical protein
MNSRSDDDNKTLPDLGDWRSYERPFSDQESGAVMLMREVLLLSDRFNKDVSDGFHVFMVAPLSLGSSRRSSPACPSYLWFPPNCDG